MILLGNSAMGAGALGAAYLAIFAIAVGVGVLVITQITAFLGRRRKRGLYFKIFSGLLMLINLAICGTLTWFAINDPFVQLASLVMVGNIFTLFHMFSKQKQMRHFIDQLPDEGGDLK